MHAGAATLAEAYPGRFVLGVGVSHRGLVELVGGDYRRPVDHMRGYLDDMDAARPRSLEPPQPFVRVLAALGPKMLDLARDRTDGALPFLVPVEHTERARQALGPDRLLVTHQAVVLERDPAAARAIVRANFGSLGDPSSVYARNLARLGYGPDHLADGLSDRLVDALVARGDEAAIARRVRHHIDAGADHVLIHPLTSENVLTRPTPEDALVAAQTLEHLAPALINTGGA